MTTQHDTHLAFLNGQQIPDSELTNLAFAGFAHFTALQVRNHRVKGLDLHSDRLRQASVALYGRTLSDEQLRYYIRSAIESGPADQSLTVTLYSPEGEFTANSMESDPAIFIRTSAPASGPSGPLRLAAIPHERPLPEIKHVGEIGKTYYLHLAIRQGFDDAAFVDRHGHLSEGSIWNLAFWDGETILWPKARMLKGTMMGIVQRQLSLLDIPQRSETITLEHLSGLQGAAVMNSWTPGISVTDIASNPFSRSEQLVSLLYKAYIAEPAERV